MFYIKQRKPKSRDSSDSLREPNRGNETRIPRERWAQNAKFVVRHQRKDKLCLSAAASINKEASVDVLKPAVPLMST